MSNFPIATNRPALYAPGGTFRHNFADHQHCLKCGKSERAPEADDCNLSDAEYESWVRRAQIKAEKA